MLFSTRNAIDKKMMEIVIHSAVKGVGPYAMVQNILSWHEFDWQKKKLLRLATLYVDMKRLPSHNQL